MSTKVCVEREDDYYEVFTPEDGFDGLYKVVEQMEAASEWIPDIPTNEIRLTGISSPMFAELSAQHDGYSLDPDLLADTLSPGGSQLVIHRTYHGRPVDTWCLRSCAWRSLLSSAKLFGSALRQMPPEVRGETLNNAFKYQKGSRLLLNRYGKISALHSNASSGYSPMKISELLSCVRNGATREFGKVRFRGGSNAHWETQCSFVLDDAKDDILTSYTQTLQGLVSANNIAELTPALLFRSSDVATSAARVIPIFISPRGINIQFVEGLAVRHELTEGKPPMDRFEEGMKSLFPLFADAFKKAAELAQIDIDYPENCVIRICKKYEIPKKYGEFARKEAEQLQSSGSRISAYDVYMALSYVIEAAEAFDAPATIMRDVEDKVARTLTCDWKSFDRGGTPSW